MSRQKSTSILSQPKVDHVHNQAFSTAYGNWHGSDLRKIIKQKSAQRNTIMKIQMSCNGWHVVTRQQFSSAFFLHEHSLSEELQGGTTALYHEPELSTRGTPLKNCFLYGTVQEVQNNILRTKV